MPEGESFDCRAGQTVLNAAHAANVLISYSCRSGQCGSCMGRLLEGEVHYPGGRPQALDSRQADDGYVLFCSAFAATDLVIELLRPEF